MMNVFGSIVVYLNDRNINLTISDLNDNTVYEYTERLECDNLSRTSKGFIGAYRCLETTITFDSSEESSEKKFVSKSNNFDNILMISGRYGRILLTALFEGMYVELICDSIFNVNGKGLHIKNPITISKQERFRNHIKRNCFSFDYTPVINYIRWDSIEVIRVDPFSLEDCQDESCLDTENYDIDKLELSVNVLDKNIVFRTGGLGSIIRGRKNFVSIDKMNDFISFWQKENKYTIPTNLKFSKVNYTSIENGSFFITSIDGTSFSIKKLVDSLSFDVFVSKTKIIYDEEDPRDYIGDATEGYTKSFLGYD